MQKCGGAKTALVQEKLTRREQNQRDTWDAIHLAAYELAEGRGLSAATVEEIASRAGVSWRTFFNYFPTKEDAILGTPAAPGARGCCPSLRRVGAGRADPRGAPVCRYPAHRFASADFLRRREIVAIHPGLRGRVMQLVTDVEHLVREAVEAATAAHEVDDAAADLLDVRLLLSGAITKHAFLRYQRAAADDLEPFINESIALFRKVVREN